MKDFNEFMSKIELRRQELGLNKHTLCSRAEIQPTYYSKLLKGDYTPNAAILFKLAVAVGLRIELVFVGGEFV